MPEGQHEPDLATCPYLPVPPHPLRADVMRRLGKCRDSNFYETALLYAHSLWLQGFPARAILLLNRALGSQLNNGDPILKLWPLPYKAMAWILTNHRTDQFIGNPRRHWQHLATRMSGGPLRELRIWRAWACWYLACLAMPEMPPDMEQIRTEGVVEPTAEKIVEHLSKLGMDGEVSIWRDSIEAVQL